MTIGTAFHPRESGLNQKLAWTDWWGFSAASTYADSSDIEYNAVRESVGAIDVSPLFKYLVTGPDAGRLVDRVITRDASKLQVNQVYYTPWCDETGKVIDDGTVTRLDETIYRWTAAEPNHRWFSMNAAGLDVDIQDASFEIAALALQGPKSRTVLELATNTDWSDLKYFRRRMTAIAGIGVDVTRTGYTGDLGYELWVPTQHAVPLWDAIFEAGKVFGIRPVGQDALDVLRVEAGLILLDAEFTSVRNAYSEEQEYSPFELGLDRLVDLDKRNFVGKRALQAEHKRGGPKRRLVGMELDWSGLEAAHERHGIPTTLALGTSKEAVPIYAAGRQIGRATSSTWSPTLKRVISLGLVEKEFARPHSRVDVEWTVLGTRDKIGATVVPLPFLDLPRKRG